MFVPINIMSRKNTTDDVNFDGYYDEDEDNEMPETQAPTGPVPSFFYNPNQAQSDDSDEYEDEEEDIRDSSEEPLPNNRISRFLNRNKSEKDPEEINSRIIQMSEMSQDKKILTLGVTIAVFLIIIVIIAIVR